MPGVAGSGTALNPVVSASRPLSAPLKSGPGPALVTGGRRRGDPALTHTFSNTPRPAGRPDLPDTTTASKEADSKAAGFRGQITRNAARYVSVYKHQLTGPGQGRRCVRSTAGDQTDRIPADSDCKQRSDR